MTIKEWIEAAIEGGWDMKNSICLQAYLHMEGNMGEVILWRFPELICIDPLAWKAVGKVKGWSGEGQKDHILEQSDAYSESYAHLCMQTMIKALWSGQTLEEYIATL